MIKQVIPLAVEGRGILVFFLQDDGRLFVTRDLRLGSTHPEILMQEISIMLMPSKAEESATFPEYPKNE